MGKTQGEIEWTRGKLDRLRAAREAALRDHLAVFDFDGYDIHVDYAKYLIEFLARAFAVVP